MGNTVRQMEHQQFLPPLVTVEVREGGRSFRSRTGESFSTSCFVAYDRLMGWEALVPSPAGSSDKSSDLQVEKGSKRKRSEHKCSLCDACSPSHKRYLGGRKTSHRKALSQSAVGALTVTGSRRIYQCSICLKGFPTGQALGGHMSHHCDFDGTSFLAGSSTMPATSLLASTEFELNILPVPEASFESVGRCSFLKKEDRVLKAPPLQKAIFDQVPIYKSRFWPTHVPTIVNALKQYLKKTFATDNSHRNDDITVDQSAFASGELRRVIQPPGRERFQEEALRAKMLSLRRCVSFPREISRWPQNESSKSSLEIRCGASTATGSRRIYQCSICLKGFLTGQALGGHMSHHCDFTEASCIAGSSTMPTTKLIVFHGV
ncbi:Zinc finger protein ZAT10 [Apostasia shenzhenica]|uniref:Zinc finger protein ZAT10 n=1 Tax=Apostasia shenzhenica TaxID=1088818 RepID=A0A2I0AFE7_9ASPA|nr:Zinc finger protein ZAT10 [Apostasia shenzhenica]